MSFLTPPIYHTDSEWNCKNLYEKICDHSGFRSHTVHTSMVYNKQLKYYATLDRTSLNPLPSGSKQVSSILFSSSLKT